MITKVSTYFHAKYLFNIAQRAASNSGTSDQDSPIISIIFSVLALEAFINESGTLAQMVPSKNRQKIVEGFSAIMGELEDRKESLFVKYHMALLVFSGSTWDEGSNPFQDFKILVSLRNTIAHAKADKWKTKVSQSEPDPERSLAQYPKFVNQLYQKKIIGLPDKSASWLEILTQQAVADWACMTARLVTEEFLKVVPDGYYKNSLSNHVLQTS